MRAGLAVIAALALCVTPAMAQGKAKTPPQAGSLAALEVCALFAGGNADAETLATEMGWDVSPGDPESLWVESTNFYKQVPGLGYAEGFVLMETYPDADFGYCRIDVTEAEGEADVALIEDLPEWHGEIRNKGAGTYGSWMSQDYGGQRLLLSHEDEYGFVLQLTVIRPKPGEGEAG
ncbi:MAG: hypothetical protein P0Y65_01995 [Candidatus Devosia phytovorans]|uniref:Uncharacterized protein n=1 Tax=Candidatus Devosia phytovorans TaxID=3121372 RepID=A0AAJ6B224_9HYPH|nr:hypothetical protein [Devosia sp.]WEK05048.1 MAG: hypothetical protein P0Y65_01995 [Devosia sp.]